LVRTSAKAVDGVRFLADESLDFSVVRALRTEGHDVLAVAEQRSGATDDEVAYLAATDERILLTEDRDFGRLFYGEHQARDGVVYLRYPAGTRGRLASDVVAAVRNQGDGLFGAFVVMQPGRVRISRSPEA
jgi:predicted nuclease of predicted toxin-antitoxin system